VVVLDTSELLEVLNMFECRGWFERLDSVRRWRVGSGSSSWAGVSVRLCHGSNVLV
jgi:hypothetical protein